MQRVRSIPGLSLVRIEDQIKMALRSFILQIDLGLQLNVLFDEYVRPGRGQPRLPVGPAPALRADKSVRAA